MPFYFDLGSFYKEIPLKHFFTLKSFVKFFPIIKLESDFFPHFLSKIRKLENCENLSILIFKCAKFQKNQRTFFVSLHFMRTGRGGLGRFRIRNSKPFFLSFFFVSFFLFFSFLFFSFLVFVSFLFLFFSFFSI